jgi:surfeit locus 1 family protein
MKNPSSPQMLFVLGLLAVLGVTGLTWLGVWQIERLAWKEALIARVDQRIHAAPGEPPAPAQWPTIDAVSAEYRRVTASGHYLNDRETLVQAVTERGSGFWVVTPFQTNQGFTMLVNRGFVPPENHDPTTRSAGQPAGTTTVTGLLRMTEPKGGFLRSNDPQGDRWYSRDVAAIAATRGLQRVAPYFVDADGTSNPGGLPIGGLTVVAFPNNHLVYAITWFGLALMLCAWAIFAAIEERRRAFRQKGARAWLERLVDPQ